MVSQDMPQVERYWPGKGGVWQFSVASGLDATVAIESIDLVLPLRDVYAKVEFEAAEG